MVEEDHFEKIIRTLLKLIAILTIPGLIWYKFF